MKKNGWTFAKPLWNLFQVKLTNIWRQETPRHPQTKRRVFHDKQTWQWTSMSIQLPFSLLLMNKYFVSSVDMVLTVNKYTKDEKLTCFNQLNWSVKWVVHQQDTHWPPWKSKSTESNCPKLPFGTWFGASTWRYHRINIFNCFFFNIKN